MIEKNAEFRKSFFRGYNRKDVEDFLAKVKIEYGKMQENFLKLKDLSDKKDAEISTLKLQSKEDESNREDLLMQVNKLVAELGEIKSGNLECYSQLKNANLEIEVQKVKYEDKIKDLETELLHQSKQSSLSSTSDIVQMINNKSEVEIKKFEIENLKNDLIRQKNYYEKKINELEIRCEAAETAKQDLPSPELISKAIMEAELCSLGIIEKAKEEAELIKREAVDRIQKVLSEI